MSTVKLKKPRNYNNPKKRYAMYASLICVALFLTSLAFSVMTKIQSDNAALRNREALAGGIQNNVNFALRAYDGFDRKSGELSSILSTIRQHLYAADSMNRILVSVYGDRYSVYDTAYFSEFEQILTRFNEQMSTGRSLDLVKEELIAYMTNVSSAVANRFGPENILLPRTASQ
jgi:hypothetical protein